MEKRPVGYMNIAFQYWQDVSVSGLVDIVEAHRCLLKLTIQQALDENWFAKASALPY